MERGEIPAAVRVVLREQTSRFTQVQYPVVRTHADLEPTMELPQPLASVVDHLGDDLDPDGRDFVPTTELIEALDVEPTAFGRDMSELGCKPDRKRMPGEDGRTRQIRGYHLADIPAAVNTYQADSGESDPSGSSNPSHPSHLARRVCTPPNQRKQQL